MGLAFKILDSKAPPAEVPKLSHKYFKMYFVDSVFPAPLSPEIKRKIKKKMNNFHGKIAFTLRAKRATFTFFLSGQKFIKNAKNGQFWASF